MIKNQKGFTVFEAVIILVAIIAIGAAGFYAYQARQNKTDYSVSVPQKKNSTKQAGDQSSFLFIKEWGVKVPQIPKDNIISYQIKDNSADFVSSEQKALGGYCGQFGSERYHMKREDKGSKPDHWESDAKANGRAITIDDFTYYIFPDFTGGVCTNDNPPAGSSMSQEEQKANNDLLELLKGLQKA